jgi:hypothetical protein
MGVIRSVYHDGAALVPIKPLVLKSGSTSGAPVPTLDSNGATRFQPREKIAIADT